MENVNKSQNEKSDAENESDETMHNSEETINNCNNNICSHEQNSNKNLHNNSPICVECENQNMLEDEYAVPIVNTKESLVSRYMAHVTQFVKMREHLEAITEKSKLDARNNTTWTERLIVQVADFAQNLDMPHSGSK